MGKNKKSNRKVDHINYEEEIKKINENLDKIAIKLEKMQENQNTAQQLQLLLSEKMSQTQEEIQQEIEKIDCTKQINCLLNNLKNSYLEQSNKIKPNDIEARCVEEINNPNIIDINILKEKKRKKNSYSINKDILYDDLEKTATCIVTFQDIKLSKYM